MVEFVTYDLVWFIAVIKFLNFYEETVICNILFTSFFKERSSSVNLGVLYSLSPSLTGGTVFYFDLFCLYLFVFLSDYLSYCLFIYCESFYLSYKLTCLSRSWSLCRLSHNVYALLNSLETCNTQTYSSCYLRSFCND